MSHSVESGLPDYGPPHVYAPVGDLRAKDLGKWIVDKALDRPKRIIRLIHNENSTSVQWYRSPEKPDGISGMVAAHDHMVTLYRAEPTSVFPPAVDQS